MFCLSCLQLCLFFFHKMMRFYKDICSAWISRTSTEHFFLTDRHHIGRKNTIDNRSIGMYLYGFFQTEKGLGIVSPPQFVYHFSRKISLILYFVKWPNLITWLHLLLEILVNICIVIVCLTDCDVKNFEINLVFLIKPFFNMTEKSR